MVNYNNYAGPLRRNIVPQGILCIACFCYVVFQDEKKRISEFILPTGQTIILR